VFPGGRRLRGGIGDVWGRLRSFSEGHRRQGQEQAPVRTGLEAVHTSHDLPNAKRQQQRTAAQTSHESPTFSSQFERLSRRRHRLSYQSFPTCNLPVF
jgi:hypothetical protein